MADEKTTKVELVVNEEKKDEVTVSEITSVEIRGATGVATYRLDPMQDTVIKLVVVGKVAQEDELPEAAPVSTENVAAYFGKAEDVKNLKEREAKVKKDAEEQAKKDAEAAKKANEADKTEERETVNVGKATHQK